MIAVTATVEEAPRRATRLATLTGATIVIQAVTALIVAGLAAARANDGVLTPAGLAGLTVGTAVASTLIGWPSGLYAGAAAVLDGQSRLDCDDACPGDRDADPFRAGNLWRSTVVLASLVALWALASAGLLAVALDNRPARVAVVIAALAGIGGVSAVVVDAAARHRGAHAALRLQASAPAAVPVRRRAWREVALPLAAAQALVNAGAAWVLFHDAPVHEPLVGGALTRSSALADVSVIITLLAVVFAVALAAPWGAVDARLGRVALDDPDAQRTSAKAPFGPQAIVYGAIAGYLLSKVVGWALPVNPTLAEVMIARGLYAGVLVAAFAAIGYVRGALNALAVAP
jgi:hypothetical protein